MIILKAKQINTIVKVKFILKGDFVTPREAKYHIKNKENAYFIKHIAAQVGNDIVYDISLSPQFRQGSQFLLMFDYKYIGRSDRIQIIVTDNTGRQTRLSKKIINSKGKNNTYTSRKTYFKSINYWDYKPKLWELTNTEEAIKELYGIKKPKLGDINIFVTEDTD